MELLVSRRTHPKIPHKTGDCAGGTGLLVD
jgi:hypothetical protein